MNDGGVQMSQSKPLASLSATLLARKGQAKPAMRPQGYASLGMSPRSALVVDDLGWDDMGHGRHDVPSRDVSSAETMAMPALEPVVEPITPHVGVTPVALVPPVVAQQQALATHFGDTGEKTSGDDKSGLRAVRGRKVAFTLRLDEDRHLRLRLASATSGCSSQRLVTEALDRFLATLADVDVLTNALGRQACAK